MAAMGRTRNEMPDEYAIAIHEAGHCRSMVQFGWPINYVTIIPNDRYAGYVEHGAPPFDADPLEDYIIGISGYEAERRLLGDRDPEYDGSIVDFAIARRRLEKEIPDMAACLAAQKLGQRSARHETFTDWPFIQTLATRLKRDRRLSGAQVLRLVREYAEKEQR
jgi:hypothetical protein